MTAKTTLQTNVTDTNGRKPRHDEHPDRVQPGGRRASSSTTARLSVPPAKRRHTKTGSAVVEAASDDDRARIWIARERNVHLGRLKALPK
ncbi:hypothetical protein [Candidatus Accumulibacter sp. ACC012]|uniref:hypothetical protein n=1 Tax=Candidatus Accumulibacter sp. ACC012 TaxID=2823332 RepID=UPI0025BBBF16|nr:hypothetical protein [Candidatus Accumulibacter sp. ACC012]